MPHHHNPAPIDKRKKPQGDIPFCLLCANPNTGTPITQDYLLEFTCDCTEPGCSKGYMYLEKHCHPHTGMLPEYCRKHGTLALVCPVCKVVQATFLIGIEGQPLLQMIIDQLEQLAHRQEDVTHEMPAVQK